MSTTLCNPFSDVAVIEQPELVPDSKPTPPAKWDAKAAIEACLARLGLAYNRSIHAGSGYSHVTDHWLGTGVRGEIVRYVGQYDGMSMRVLVLGDAGSDLYVFGFPRGVSDLSILEAAAVAMINAANNTAIT